MSERRSFWLKIIDYEHHRNGVGGRPFYLVSFTMYDEGEEDNLLAVVPQGAGYCGIFVINPEDLDSKWRGDEIGERLISLMLNMEGFEDFGLKANWEEED